LSSFGVVSNKPLPDPRLQRFSSIISSKNCIV
jgi:hypothetical protein